MSLQQPAYCKGKKNPNKNTLLVGCCVQRNLVSVLKYQFKHKSVPLSQKASATATSNFSEKIVSSAPRNSTEPRNYISLVGSKLWGSLQEDFKLHISTNHQQIQITNTAL